MHYNGYSVKLPQHSCGFESCQWKISTTRGYKNNELFSTPDNNTKKHCYGNWLWFSNYYYIYYIIYKHWNDSKTNQNFWTFAAVTAHNIPHLPLVNTSGSLSLTSLGNLQSRVDGVLVTQRKKKICRHTMEVWQTGNNCIDLLIPG